MVKKFAALRREIARVRRQSGVWEVLRCGGTRCLKWARSLVFSRLQEIHPFDLEHGTDTSGTVDLGALVLPLERADQAVRYQTAIVEVFTEMLERLPGGGEDCVFVDLGSGKGRALLLASWLPFKEIIGLELSAELHAVAWRNIAILRDAGQRCHRIRSVCQDAGSFEFSPEKLVIYLFNPNQLCVANELPLPLLQETTVIHSYQTTQETILSCLDLTLRLTEPFSFLRFPVAIAR